MTENEKKYFRVAITETLRRVVTVEAADEEDARRKVMDSWKNSEIILVAEDFEGAEFFTVGEGTAEEADKEKAAREALDFRPDGEADTDA